jgi:hypothetical protein
MGMRVAYSHAYHHQANGHAEAAGQQVTEKLRKLHHEEGLGWMEALPRVLDRYHDTKGESGVSPYEIVFGRPRPMAELPSRPVREREDVKSFFARQEEMDEKISRVLNDKHAKSSEHQRGVERSFEVNDIVWVRRPEHTADKFGTRWIGPGVIVAREGARSYLVRVEEDGPGYKKSRVMTVPLQFLKAHEQDTHGEDRWNLFYHKRTDRKSPHATISREVEHVHRHRSVEGRLEVQVSWKGDEGTSTAWESFNEIFPENSQVLAQYAHKKGLGPEMLAQWLKKTPTPGR